MPAKPGRYVLPKRLNDIDPAEHLGLVRRAALDYGAFPGAIHDSDQFSDGCVGLMEAKRAFNPHCGIKFSTYATWRIMGCVRSRKNTNARRLKRGELDPVHLSQAPTPNGYDGENEGFEPADPRDGVAEFERRELLFGLLNRLHRRERHIVTARWLGRFTLEEIAARLKISKERVRQIESKALAKMRRMAATSKGEQA